VAQAEVDAEVIPSWRLPLGDEEPLGGVVGPRHQSATYRQVEVPIVSSSEGQDQQRCPLLSLPADVIVTPEMASWLRVTGDWRTPNDIVLATWEQNLFTTRFRRLYVKNAVEGHLAVQTRTLADRDLKLLYGFDEPAVPGASTALIDCDKRLLFVVRELTDPPQALNIYGRDGSLLATTITAYHDIPRYQFVDPTHGFLLAIAESPGIWANVSRSNIPVDAARGYIMPYQIHFYPGGYANYSRLMDIDYRWVIAAAVQVQAVNAAQKGFRPWLSLTVLQLLIAASICVGLALTGLVIFTFYRCVYPHHETLEERKHGRALDNPFLLTPRMPPPDTGKEGAADRATQQPPPRSKHGGPRPPPPSALPQPSPTVASQGILAGPTGASPPRYGAA